MREFQHELAGRLALLDTPGAEMQGLREKHGFTQEQLAGLLGLRRESLSRIEGGKVSLTLPILQRFSRVVTLAKAVREHLAYADARGNLADERHLDMLASSLLLDHAAADEIVLVATMAYEKKKRDTIRSMPAPLVRRTL